MNTKLPKSERLHAQKSIKELFDKGSSFFLYPFKVLVLQIPASEPQAPQVLFSVSKKKLKKAVQRNLIKRRIRESYRLNKHILTASAGTNQLIGLIFVSSEEMSFDTIQGKIIKVLQKINHEQPPAIQSKEHVDD
ncbi:ribonuclease P protein component [Mongoliitalea daihaiensis]|uniref:ribonuclease P protein component n=1 Tax=Mongoliitalea daihaiensis TaxID=2782006 RepID=UPI001F2D5460|nr:ribonuclease P protein component [Mongoliitalea daihaiensis]UJP66618.1 ribonuclease P protein component [Mongoliitalea daihaiensis]